MRLFMHILHLIESQRNFTHVFANWQNCCLHTFRSRHELLLPLTSNPGPFGMYFLCTLSQTFIRFTLTSSITFSLAQSAVHIHHISRIYTLQFSMSCTLSKLQLIMYSNSFQRVSSSIYFSFYIVFTFYSPMISKMSCPWELRGLRARTEDGRKFCFTYNLGKDCSQECGFVHRCMKCGYEKCWAQGCFLGSGHGPRSQPYPTSVAEASSSSKDWRTYNAKYDESSSSSKDGQISLLNKKIGELQRRVEKRDLYVRDLARTVKRMEQTLKHHGFDLNSLQEISSSDID